MNLAALIDSAPISPVTDPLDMADVNRYCNEVAAWCNEKTQVGIVPTADVVRVLTLMDAMEDIRVAAEKGDGDTNAKTMAARKMVSALRDFDSFDLSNPVYLNAVTERLGALVTHGLLTDEQKAVLLALGGNRLSRAEAHGLPTVSPSQVYTVKGF